MKTFILFAVDTGVKSIQLSRFSSYKCRVFMGLKGHFLSDMAKNRVVGVP